MGETKMPVLDEKYFAATGNDHCEFRADDVATSRRVRAEYEQLKNVIHAEDMPFEKSADGLIKHLVHHRMDTRECCVEAYMQFLEASEKSGRHRHMWEEVVFVMEGSGHDLHWDIEFDCKEEFEWSWKAEPRKFTWERGDFIYIPPFTEHQHIADAGSAARLIVISNRIVKEMGFNWFDQIEAAPGYSKQSKDMVD
jgi:gentisate 1,2-dioxygenase